MAPDEMEDVAREAERTIRRVAPKLRRVIKHGAPTYQGARDVLTIGVWKRFVAVGLWQGAKLACEHPGLLGRGVRTRTFRLRTRAEARSRAFAALVRAAAKLDAASGLPARSGKKEAR